MLDPPRGQRSSPTADRVAGKTFEIGSNPLDLTKVSFAFLPEACVVTFHEGKTGHAIRCGLEKWERGETGLPGTPPRLIAGGAPPLGTEYKVAASGTWKDAQTFEMTWRYHETPHHDVVTCRFDGDAVRVTFLNSISKMNPGRKEERPELVGRLTA